MAARRAACGVLAGALSVALLAAGALPREIAVVRADERLARQDGAAAYGLAAPALGVDFSGLRQSARADLADALYLSRGVRQAGRRDGAVRLNDAATRVARAVRARPHWGDAAVVQAYVEERRRGWNAAAQSAFVRSYADAPYLRHAAAWRVDTGFDHWQALDPETQRRVIDEGVWLTRIAPEARDHVFAAARAGPAFVLFLLRWRTFRVRDADYRSARGAP